MKNNVKFILGEAGTAKTTYLIKIVEELNKTKNIACLAFTHSAVNNMKNKTNNLKNITFKTIHSFLGIVPKTTYSGSQSLIASTGGYIRNKKCCSFDYDVLIIDEFTLIPLDIFNMLLSEYCEHCEKIVVAGDLLQLPPPDSYEFVNEELFKDKVFEVNTDILTAIKIAKHLSQTAFNSDWFKNSNRATGSRCSSILILQKNFRNGSNVKNILDEILKIESLDELEKLISYSKSKSSDQPYQPKNPLYKINSLINDGYVVIGSKYYLLKKIMKNWKVKTDSVINSPIGLIDSKQELYLTENIDSNFSNGDIVKVVGLYDEYIEIIKEDAKASCDKVAEPLNKIKLKPNSETIYPIMPLNFITIHKAQGKTYDKIIVILDDMFELSMLYTAITRAKEDVKFVCFNIPKAFKEIKEQNKAFNLLKQIVYDVK